MVMETYHLYVGDDVESYISYIGFDYLVVEDRALKLQAMLGKTVFIAGDV